MIKPPEMERTRKIMQDIVYPTPLVTSDFISHTVGLKIYFTMDDQHV